MRYLHFALKGFEVGGVSKQGRNPCGYLLDSLCPNEGPYSEHDTLTCKENIMTTSTFINIFVSSSKRLVSIENKSNAIQSVLDQAFSGEGQFRGDGTVDLTVLVRVIETGTNREVFSMSHHVSDVDGVYNAISFAYRRVCW